MEIALVLYFDKKVTEKSDSINCLSNKLGQYFEDKNYSNAVKVIYIGIICVGDEFKEFFKPRKPKFTKSKAMLEYDREFDFDIFKSIEPSEIVKIVLYNIIESISIIKEKVTDFDIERFVEDLFSFSKENEIDLGEMNEN